MRGWRPVSVLGLALGVLAMSAGPATARDAPMRPGHPNPVADEHRAHVGILGEVVRPGVYAARGLPPSLDELIEHAGGLTPNASGLVCIVRNGRIEALPAADRARNVSLQPGDVVIAEPHFTPPEAVRLTAHPAADLPRQIAVVGLLDRPAVLKVRAADCTPEALTALLGQGADAAASVRVLHAVHWERALPVSVDSAAPLPDRAVLVFHRAAIHPESLPPLPEPYELSAGEESDAEDNESLPLPQVVENAPRAVPLGPLPDLPGLTPESPLPPHPDALDLPEHWLRESQPLPAQTAPAPLPEPADAVPQILPPQNTASSLAASPEVSPWRSLTTTVATAIGVVAVLFAGRLLWSRRRIEAGIPSPVPAAAPAPSLLRAMIEARLPLVEEGIRLAPTLQMFGRPAGPLSLRIDPPEALQGPHLRPEVPTDPAGSPGGSPRESAAGRQVRADAGHPSAVPGQPFGGPVHAGVVGRALATVQGARQP